MCTCSNNESFSFVLLVQRRSLCQSWSLRMSQVPRQTCWSAACCMAVPFTRRRHNGMHSSWKDEFVTHAEAGGQRPLDCSSLPTWHLNIQPFSKCFVVHGGVPTAAGGQSGSMHEVLKAKHHKVHTKCAFRPCPWSHAIRRHMMTDESSLMLMSWLSSGLQRQKHE